MEFLNRSKQTVLASAIIVLLSACGGGSGGKSDTPSTTDITAPDAPSAPSFKRLTGGKVTVTGTAEAKSTVKVTFSDGSSVSAIVADDGKYSATSSTIIKDGSVDIIATDLAGNESVATHANIPAAQSRSVNLTVALSPTVPLIGLPYISSIYHQSGVTKSNGAVNYKEGETLKVTIAGHDYTLIPKASGSLDQLLPANTNNETKQNLKLILKHLDKDSNASNGIDLTGVSANIDATESAKTVTKKLYASTGRMPELLFKPSLGINTEAPQGDGAVGQPMAFVDVFRTARPFGELSGEVVLDSNGWPTTVDADLGYARTKLLQGTLKGAMPAGKYTLLYDGEGTIQLGGRRANVKALSGVQKGLTFDWNPIETDDPEDNGLTLVVRDISPGEGNYIKNIQIIMPGGVCTKAGGDYNPFIHADSASDCPNNTTYQTYVSLKSDSRRNEIENVIFNPDYVRFLREFKVVRMMNLMEASHGKNTCDTDDGCPDQVDKWENRATLSDSVWGGTAESSFTERNGVPVEVVVKLANTLKRDIWVNMPHSANNNYVEEFAKYLNTNLDSKIKLYLEYSNEIWNSGFTGHAYVATKGKTLGLDSIPDNFQRFCDGKTEAQQNKLRCGKYFAGLRYYSLRSVELFHIWKEQFGGSTDRFIRVLGTSQGDKIRTEEMIKYVGQTEVDAIAMAPYFFGCTVKTGACANAPKVLSDATTVDDVFDIVDQTIEQDPSALDGTIAKIKNQLEITSKYNLKLVTYEGGQHLTTSVMGAAGLSEPEKDTFRALFKATNRDPRMKQRYEKLLNAWKGFEDEGATLFTLYTLPQSFYRHGNWGLKEHLNKSRSESPKYDGVMSFQESVGECWWDNCRP